MGDATAAGTMTGTLAAMGRSAGERLLAAGETVAVSESSSGGLVSAALLAVPGASAWFVGGGVVYTGRARHRLLGIEREQMEGIRSASEPYALLCARTVRERLATTWGVAETGAAGPSGNGYGDPPGHTCVAVAGPVERVVTVETRLSDREVNMWVFARATLELLARVLGERSP